MKCRIALALLTTVALLMFSGAGALSASAVAGASTGNTWATVAPMSTARYAPEAVAGSDGRIYALGGGDMNGIFRTVEAYTLGTDSWAAVTAMPNDQYQAAAATGFDGRIYVFGGFQTSVGYVNTVQAYAPRTDSWSTLTPMPTARGGEAAVAGSDGRIYVFGGYNNNFSGSNGGYISTVEAYTPQTNSWTTMAPMPTPRQFVASAVGSDGRIYVFGGRNSSNSSLNTVEAYNPQTNTWTAMAPMPTDRFGPAAAAGGDGRIYVFGGTTNAIGVRNTVEAYKPETNEWTTVAPMPTSRGLLAVATGPDGRLYAIGGGNNFGAGVGGPLKTAEAYTIGQTHTTPPATLASTYPVPNAAGWSATTVTVTLTATSAPGGAAVQGLTYSATGAQSLSSTTVAGGTTSITFADEGVTTLSFFATDQVGTQEQPKTLVIRIDKTLPVTTVKPAPGALLPELPLLNVTALATVKSSAETTLGTIPVQCWDTRGVVLKLASVDNAGGSGVAGLAYAASGAQTIALTTVNGVAALAAAQPSITARGLTRLTYAAVDVAGNQELTQSESVIVGVGFGCAGPTPLFSLPTHGRVVVTGTATINGDSIPFSRIIRF